MFGEDEITPYGLRPPEIATGNDAPTATETLLVVDKIMGFALPAPPAEQFDGFKDTGTDVT